MQPFHPVGDGCRFEAARIGSACGGAGNHIAIHSTGVVGLVYDHRAFDGSTASLFLLQIRDALQDRDWEAEVG
jgi:pyruvate/2-oxoglutarate dehydrogenase complex dihydrolipoamide acyltransferase (E2) component